MAILSRDSLLGSCDLEEREIHLPTLGGSVRVRSLPAAYSNLASSEATEMVTTEHKGRAQQTMRVNGAKLETLKVFHGLVEPKLNSLEDAETFSQKCGRAWKTIVDAIDELSGLDDVSVEHTTAMFPGGGPLPAGPLERDAVGTGNGGPAVPERTGA